VVSIGIVEAVAFSARSMPKTPINVTESLRRAVADMSEKTNVALVGLVLRFNGDDDSIRTMWSEASNQKAHPDNPGAADRGLVWRLNKDEDPVAGERPTSPVADKAGYHAEELLIACWPVLLRGADLREEQVRAVDLILSKSPCYGAKGSSPLRVEPQSERLPAGCASKLASFVRAKSTQIEWRIAFLALAGSDAPSYTPIGGERIDRLMSERERELATHAQRQVESQAKLPLEAVLNARRVLEALPQPLRPGLARVGKVPSIDPAANENPQEKKARLDANKAIASYNKAVASLNTAATSNLNAARLPSIRLAQEGIVVLDRLPNVDVRRWTG